VLLPELVRQSTQEAARLSYSLKGTGCSDYALTGADHGFPLSQNVSLWRRIFPNRRVNRRLMSSSFAGRRVGLRQHDLTVRAPLRHNNYQATAAHADSRATPPHRQNQLSVALSGIGLVVQTEDCTDQVLTCQVAVNSSVRNDLMYARTILLPCRMRPCAQVCLV